MLALFCSDIFLPLARQPIHHAPRVLEREIQFTRALKEPTVLSGGFNEAALQRLWFEHALPRHLLTSDGQRAEIVQTGWWNREGGPDFRDAAVRFGGNMVRSGDVELHLDAADWEGHGHHRDPAYNGTILHVALAGKLPSFAGRAIFG